MTPCRIRTHLGRLACYFRAVDCAKLVPCSSVDLAVSTDGAYEEFAVGLLFTACTPAFPSQMLNSRTQRAELTGQSCALEAEHQVMEWLVLLRLEKHSMVTARIFSGRRQARVDAWSSRMAAL